MTNEIEDAIKSIISQVRNGLGDMELKSPIKLELTTQVESNSSGGLDFKIVKGNSSSDITNIQKITIEFGEVDPFIQNQLSKMK